MKVLNYLAFLAFCLWASFSLTACGKRDRVQYVPVVAAQVAGNDTPVACEIWTSLSDSALYQTANTNIYLAQPTSTRGNISVKLKDINFVEEPSDLIPFTQFLGTVASGVTSNFSMRCTFYYDVKTAGSHTFKLTSDDGSQLYVDGTRYIDNGGAHGVTMKQASVTLPVGLHEMRVLYYQGNGPKSLNLTVQAPSVAPPVVTF